MWDIIVFYNMCVKIEHLCENQTSICGSKTLSESIRLYLPMKILWHRVIAVSSPWMTTQDALAGKIYSFEWTVPFYGLDGVCRASRGVSARWREQGRNALLIKLYWKQQKNNEQLARARKAHQYERYERLFLHLIYSVFQIFESVPLQCSYLPF